MKLFFDTSALVKYFHDEAGTQQVVSLITDQANEIWVSDLTRVEFLSALYRKVRTGELEVDRLREAVIGFERLASAVAAEGFHVISVPTDKNPG